MAPNTSPKLTPPRRSLTSKGFERKKPGPVPKPLSERLKKKPLKQVKRIERSYSRERKVEVLLYLLQHRVPDTRLRKVPRRRIGQPHEEELTQPMVTNEYGEYVWYRAPTYSEASEFWKIPTPTIQGWWDAREKILEGTGIQIPQVGPGGFSTAIADQIGPEGESGGEGSPSGDGGPSGERSPSGQGEPATTNGAPPTPSSSPNAASAPSTTRPGPGSAPVPKPVLHPFSRTPPPPPVEMLPPDWKPPTSPRVIGLMAPARPTRGSNGGFRIEGTQAPRLAPAPPGPVGHAVPQGPRHVAGPPHAYAGPHPPSPPGIPPPAFNPAHYVVLYTGPHPGGPWDFPGQHYLPPGVALPIVYANQPVGVAPAGFVSVYPAPPAPVPNGPAPNTTHHPHHYPNPTIGQPPVSHGVHAPLHRPYPPQGPPQPPQPPSFNGKSPITPSDGPTLPAAQTPYSGPTGYVSPYAPHGVAGPRPIAPAHSPPPTPTANAGAGNPPKVAIPRLTPNRMADQTQPAPPPPPSAQPTGPPQQKHHQTTPVVVDDNDDDDGSIIKSRDQTQNAGSCTRGGEEDSTSDTSTPSDGKGGRASSQTSSPPEGAVAQGEAALVPAGNTILETETAQASEIDMKNSTTSDPAVSEDEETTAAETEANQASSLSAEVGQETLMMDIDTEQHASPTSSEENDEDSEDQYLTPAEEAVDTPSIESIVEDVMMQVSMETPGAGDDGIE